MTLSDRKRGAPAVLAVLIGATSAAAQPLSSVAIPQISSSTAGTAGQAVRISPITGVGANGSRRSDAASAPTQLGDGARPATAMQSLSSPAQGRAVGVPALTGSDRCEPGASLATSQICEQRIESRADQYNAPAAAPVTAEGRLLMLMTPTGRQGPEGAAGRIGEGGPDLRDFVGQAAGQVGAALGQQGAEPAASGAPTGLPATVVINAGR